MSGGPALDEQGRRLTLAADLAWRARRCAADAAGTDLPALARRLAGIAPAVERAHRVRFDPAYPGAGAGVEDVRGGRRLVLGCRALDAPGAVEAVVFTTLIEGRPPQVSVAPAGTPLPGGGLEGSARRVPARAQATQEGRTMASGVTSRRPGAADGPDALGDGPLSGLRAIEFGQLIAGPYVGTLLADFGADLVKVEAPPDGDALREWGRHRHNGHSLWWSVMSRNKRSVALDLRTDDGRRRALELCASADVVVENFRPGTMEKWGLGPEDVHAINAGCVYARVSGYGQTGRYRDRPGFASAGEAIGGLRYINGYPGQAPPRPGISLGDTLAAQSAFQGILLALYARDARGAAGQVVDASIADACFAMLESAVAEYEKCGAVREPSGPIIPGQAPSNVYRSSDAKWVVIAANHDTLWRRLAELMGRPELGEDERFATVRARGDNQELLDEMIGEWAARHTAAELDDIVNEAGVVCAPVYSVADIHEDPYFRERGLLVEIEDEVHGPMTVPGVVPKLSRTPGRVRRPARWTVGADTEDVLGDGAGRA